MNIVELNQAQKRYQGVHALKPLDLTLGQGELLGLFGHNGAGKTTIIKLLLGLIEPTQGEVRIFGQDPALARARNLRYQVGFLQENVSFYDQLTGEEVLRFFAKLKGVDRSQCAKLFEQVGLTHAIKRRVKTYSKGMRQRLGLAQALLGEPRLLLLDEPTVGLDPIATKEFYQLIDNLKRQGCTIVLCSHVLPGVEKYIDRALIMGQGKLLAQGNLDDLRRQANLPVTMALSGEQLQIPTQLAQYCQSTEQGQELKVSMAQKMPVMRQLMALTGLENIDIHLPTLEDLYSHYMATLHLTTKPAVAPGSI